MTQNPKIRVGVYGLNGHQIHNALHGHPDAELAAFAGCDFERAHPALQPRAELQNERAIPEHAGLGGLLEDDSVDLVSLCSPRRADQAADAIRCLRAGKHVLAEKPGAMSEAELDDILAVAEQTGRQFHEMAGTVFAQPYWAARELVRGGELGEVVQVFAQKSYQRRPGERPKDESVDGGLVRQCGIHAVRMIEHISGLRVERVEAEETGLGRNENDSDLRMAASLLLRLSNGAVATVVANYLCPPGFKHWQNEHFRLFGTNGFVETTDGGTTSAIYLDEGPRGPLDTSANPPEFFDQYAANLRHGRPFVLSLEDELHPLRVVLRAKADADRRCRRNEYPKTGTI